MGNLLVSHKGATLLPINMGNLPVTQMDNHIVPQHMGIIVVPQHEQPVCLTKRATMFFSENGQPICLRKEHSCPSICAPNLFQKGQHCCLSHKKQSCCPSAYGQSVCLTKIQPCCLQTWTTCLPLREKLPSYSSTNHQHGHSVTKRQL